MFHVWSRNYVSDQVLRHPGHPYDIRGDRVKYDSAEEHRKPSLAHSNRKGHNWLIYNCYDRSLVRNSRFVRGTVYDLGAGEAPYKEWILKLASRYIAVDWQDSRHESANIDISADLNQRLPIANGVADAALAFSVLEHLHSPQTMIAEAYRILRPGGHMLMQTPWQWWIHEEPHDYFRYTPYALRHMMERAGFTEVQIEPQAGFFTTIILKLNYFSLRLIRGPRLLRFIITAILSLFWLPMQFLAPLLDKLDRHWELEAPGYFLVAKKEVSSGPTEATSA